MITLSRWGRDHKTKARILLVIAHVALTFLAINLGQLLIDMNFHLPPAFLYSFLVLFLVIFISYPVRTNSKYSGAFYVRRKTADYLLALATFGMITGMSNRTEPLQSGFIPLFGSSVINPAKGKILPTAAEIIASLQYRDKSTLTRMEKKVLKKEFKKQLKGYVLAKLTGNKAAADNSAAIILTIIGAIGLFFLVGAIACNLSCNGSEGAALAVGLLGTAAIIIGMLAILKGIKRKKMKAQEKTQPST